MKKNHLQKFLMFMGLISLAILGNRLSIPFFFGVDFIFGSIFVFIILIEFGFAAAIPASLAASLYTYFLWNHPYAIVIFLVEILMTGLLYRRFGKNIVLLDTVFWLAAGIPLIYLFYGVVMELPGKSVLLIMLKQSVNGIFNVLIAFIIITIKPLVWGCRKKAVHSVSFRNLIFILILLSLSIPALAIIVVFARHEFKNIQGIINQDLNTASGDINENMKDWLSHRIHSVQQMAREMENQPNRPSPEIQNLLRLVTTLNPDFHNVYIADERGITTAFFPSTNENGASTIGLDFSDRNYYWLLKQGHQLVISDVFQGRGGIFSPIVTISVPIYHQKQFNGFALAALKVTHIENIARRAAVNRLGNVTVIDRNHRVIASTFPGRQVMTKYNFETVWDVSEVGDGLFQGFRKEDDILSQMKRWGNSVYIRAQKAPVNEDWTIIIEIRLRSFIQRLEEFYISSMLFIFSLSVGAVALSLFIATIMVGSLLKLQEASNDLPQRVERGERIQWPFSLIHEIRNLSSNFSAAGDKLALMFEKLTDSRNELEKQVENRTLALLAANEELKESHERIKTIINTAEDGIISINESGTVLLYNNAAERIFQYSADEILGHNISVLIPQPVHELHAGYIDQYLKTGERQIIGIGREVTGQKKDGSQFPLRLAIGELKKNGQSHFVGVAVDITRQKEIEKDLIRSKEEAEAANRAKSEFLANMSHEIRTPMNAIIGFSNLLGSLVSGKTQKNYLESIQNAGKNLLTLINDVLDLSKIEAGQLKIKSNDTSIARIFSEMEQIFRLKISEKGLNFQSIIDKSIPPLLLLDETRIRQILLNLVGNAVKFTHQGSIILLAQSTESPSEKGCIDLEIRVEDTGIGIADDQLNWIFGLFRKQDGQSTSLYGGTGLGIPISQRLVNMMNGELSVSSQVGKGSIFKLTLHDVVISERMVLPESDQLPPGFDFRAISFAPANILVTDDTESNRILIVEILRQAGLAYIEADSGEKSIQMAERYQPGLIIMDLRMPGMDGFQTTQRLKTDPSTRHIPVIALTAATTENMQEEMKSVAFDGILFKPLSARELIFQMSRFLPHENKGERGVDSPGGDDSLKTKTRQKPRNPDQLDQDLRKKIFPAWNDLKGALDMEAISGFTSQLSELATQHEAFELSHYCKNLEEAIQRYDVRSLKTLLEQFSEVVAPYQNYGTFDEE